MERIKDIAQKAITQGSCGGSQAECAKNEKLVTRLFGVLGAQYGSRWTSLLQNEDAMNAALLVWGRALDGLDPMVIKNALDRLPDEYPGWPPTVGEFLAVCNIGVDPSLPEFKALPKPWGDEQVALPAFDELRKILRY